MRHRGIQPCGHDTVRFCELPGGRSGHGCPGHGGVGRVALDKDSVPPGLHRGRARRASTGKWVENSAARGGVQAQQVSDQADRLGGRVAVSIADDRDQKEAIVCAQYGLGRDDVRRPAPMLRLERRRFRRIAIKRSVENARAAFATTAERIDALCLRSVALIDKRQPGVVDVDRNRRSRFASDEDRMVRGFQAVLGWRPPGGVGPDPKVFHVPACSFDRGGDAVVSARGTDRNERTAWLHHAVGGSPKFVGRQGVPCLLAKLGVRRIGDQAVEGVGGERRQHRGGVAFDDLDVGLVGAGQTRRR
jgi:hypothetical protein